MISATLKNVSDVHYLLMLSMVTSSGRKGWRGSWSISNNSCSLIKKNRSFKVSVDSLPFGCDGRICPAGSEVEAPGASCSISLNTRQRKFSLQHLNNSYLIYLALTERVMNRRHLHLLSTHSPPPHGAHRARSRRSCPRSLWLGQGRYRLRIRATAWVWNWMLLCCGRLLPAPKFGHVSICSQTLLKI